MEKEKKEYTQEEKEAVRKKIESEIVEIKQTAQTVNLLPASSFAKERDNIVTQLMLAAARIDDLYHAYLQEIDFADRVLQELQTAQNCLADLGVIEFQDEEPDISEL